MTANPREQTRVIQRPAFAIVEPEPVRKTQRQETRADHVLHRLPQPEIRPKRQQRDHLRNNHKTDKINSQLRLQHDKRNNNSNVECQMLLHTEAQPISVTQLHVQWMIRWKMIWLRFDMRQEKLEMLPPPQWPLPSPP